MGMQAVHPGAAKGLRQANIPLRVRNTFEPDDDGTVIRREYASSTPQVEIVTGMCGVYALEFLEQDMVGVKGYDAAILDVLQRHRARVITKSSNANTIVHYLEGSPKVVKRVVNSLNERFESAQISTRKVAIVSAIGSDLNVRGLTAKAVAALSSGSVDILGVHQLLRDVDIMFVINERDYQRAVSALHHALIERDSAHSAGKDSATRAA
jgi:aspartate kinase